MNELIIICAKYCIVVSACLVAVSLVASGEKKKFLRSMAITFGSALLAWVIAHVLKDIVAHPRPEGVPLFTANDVYSFPSGHATFMTALAASFFLQKISSKVATALFVLALLTGVARVLAGVHFWYDIVGGCVLGLCVAYVVFMGVKKWVR